MSHFAEEYHLDIAAGRANNKKASAPSPAEPCSRWALFLRHHDRSRDQWTEWEEIKGRKLWEKYGATVDEWKQSAKRWIEVGGTYEIKIVQITERVEWSIHYENVQDHESPEHGGDSK